MNNFRFLTAGESHGKCLTAIIEGLPSNLEIDEEFINNELRRRQIGYGRGDRMKIEADKVEILSGVRFGKTLGSPLCLMIKNNDWENWSKIMSTKAEDYTDEKSFSVYRPGHADYAGSIKYGFEDLRNVLERSSARKTAIEVAVGAVAKLLLKKYGIEGFSKILQVQKATTEDEIHRLIDETKDDGDTLGGKIKVIYKNVPIGLGSYVHWDRGLDGKIAQAVMSIPAVKSVSIGYGDNAHLMKGSEFHDEMFVENGKIVRHTNHAGGIEGGMSNGEDIEVTLIMKPIPTLKKPLNSVDIKINSESKAYFERSDTCAIEACAVVAEARLAWVLADEILGH